MKAHMPVTKPGHLASIHWRGLTTYFKGSLRPYAPLGFSQLMSFRSLLYRGFGVLRALLLGKIFREVISFHLQQWLSSVFRSMSRSFVVLQLMFYC